MKITKVEPKEALDANQEDFGHFIGDLMLPYRSKSRKDQITEVLGFEPEDAATKECPEPEYRYTWTFRCNDCGVHDGMHGQIYTRDDEYHYSGPTELIEKIFMESNISVIISEWLGRTIRVNI